MDFREKIFVKLPNPHAYALFILMFHREKKNKWQRFVQKRRYKHKYIAYDSDVRDQMVYKLKGVGLLEDKSLCDGRTIPVTTEKGMRAIRNRRVDDEVSWMTYKRENAITRILAIIAVVISILALIVQITRA